MPDTIDYSRTIPVMDEVDVLVIGGGPSGISAAVAAARAGARTRLVERYGFLGGNLTAGLVGPCMTSYSLDGKQQLIRGVFEEFVEGMVAIGGALHPRGIPASTGYCGFIEYGHDKVTPFQPEAAKIVAQRLCVDAGVDLLYHSMVVDSVVEEVDGRPRVAGVICAAKGGLHVQRAKVVVDCSADGDVAAFAGVRTRYGRESDGLAQPLTQFFRVQNIDDAKVEDYVKTHSDDFRPFSSIVERATAEGRFPAPRRGIGMYRTLEPGVWRINTGRILGRNGSDAFDLTRAELDGREQTMKLVEFFRAELPGFENCGLLDTATNIGVRETRRIEGEYELTLEDLESGRHFRDVVALCGYPVDIHSPTDSGGGTDESGPKTANVYEIPYRVMVPKEHDGLLVSGRAVSATHEALSAIRVMPPCFALGQAAGAAAAIAALGGLQPRQVGYNHLRAELLRNGAYLGEEADQSPVPA